MWGHGLRCFWSNKAKASKVWVKPVFDKQLCGHVWCQPMI
jgi:hypothetical protein